MAYYGRAIDAFLEDAQREAARGVANKIIRVRPSAVRTLCTLTWLDLAAGHQATALLHLRDYAVAAKDARQHDRAATQIFAMARIAADAEFVEAVADALDSLDFSRRGGQVRRWVSSGSPDALTDPVALSDACLAAAVRSEKPGAVMLQDIDEGAEAVADVAEPETDPPAAEGTPPSDEADRSTKRKKKKGGKNEKKYRWD